GFSLSGGGYRSSDAQIAARRANCGGDVYNKPASQCRPPTARPGQSMHERGLAIDFTWNGRLISSGNPAFQWLRGNASRFGLYNLPREPWHWSTNGN
ncbi:MAG TPA: M15 family metallopeptidase, partial [Acidimicrobiales bacterium]|nr:M15 family metallopeptidase [Acidimicrobiales bacterium]